MILWDHMVSNTELRGGGDSFVSNRVQKEKKKKSRKLTVAVSKMSFFLE